MEGIRTALLVVPGSNTTVAPEMAALLPGYGRQLVARVSRPPRMLTVEEIPAYADATVAAAEPFVRDRPDLVVFGCTAAGFLAGPEGNRMFTTRLEQQFGVPVVSMADAMIEALHHNKATTVAVVTPYHQPVNDGLRAYLAGAGITVDVLRSLECPTIEALVQVTEREVLELALGTAGSMHDALFIACSQLPTLGILAPLRERLGIPVWSSVSATAWVAAHAVRDARSAA